jgi:hypothetical protein
VRDLALEALQINHAIVVDAHELEAEAPLRALDGEMRVARDDLPVVAVGLPLSKHRRTST